MNPTFWGLKLIAAATCLHGAVENVTRAALRRTGFGRMFVRCKWCKPERITAIKICRPSMDGRITDTICETCLQEQLAANGLEPYVRPAPYSTRLPGKVVIMACISGTAAGLLTMGAIVLCA